MLQCQCLTYRVCVSEVGDSVLMHFEMHSGPVVCCFSSFPRVASILFGIIYYLWGFVWLQLLCASNVVDFMTSALLTKFLSNYSKLGRGGSNILLILMWEIYRARKHKKVYGWIMYSEKASCMGNRKKIGSSPRKELKPELCLCIPLRHNIKQILSCAVYLGTQT